MYSNTVVVFINILIYCMAVCCSYDYSDLLSFFPLLRQLYLPVYIRKTFAVPSIPFFVTFPCLVILSD